ncbi:flagellar operon protein [Melghiribacillus thermohalophilus]|uniref:Flagellar operon protein n=2 Tax=Melghiribacillus thermohalophilus TaxID=1324956 RepID=A0A4R3NAZ5_9BACI|nr:flagellar operon protein [Melghiribacillus thermohalophilus]
MVIMDHRVHQLQNHPLTIPGKPIQRKKAVGPTFQSYLDHAAGTLKVSKHAQKRMDERNIQISASTWNQIQEKVKEAKTKGVTDSIVILNQAALVVSAKNNTVITAMDRTEAGHQIFTNVNGAIILNDS